MDHDPPRLGLLKTDHDTKHRHIQHIHRLRARLSDLETVHFDGVLFADLLLDEEGLHGLTLVALELQNLAFCLLVLEHCAVAAMLLLDGLQDLLQIESFSQTSHGSDGLSAVALLDTDVDVSLIKFDRTTADFGSGRVRKWICKDSGRVSARRRKNPQVNQVTSLTEWLGKASES